MTIEKVKINKILLKILQIVVFVGAVYFVYVKLNEINWNDEILSTFHKLLSYSSLLILLLVFLLQFLNWFIEAVKFKIILSLFTKVSLWNSIKSIYCGNAIGLLTPDRLGTFAGRGIYFKEIKMVSVFSATMVGNLTQLITTLLMGVVSLGILLANDFSILSGKSEVLLLSLLLSLIGLILLLIVLFNIHVVQRTIAKMKYLKKYKEQIEFLNLLKRDKSGKVLAFSLLRYAIFSSQLYLVMSVLQVEIGLVEFIAFVGALYLITTFIPSPFMGNLGTREAVALFLLEEYHAPASVVVALLLIWLINVAIPAIIGSSLLMLKRRNF